MDIQFYYILYCGLTDSYLYEERENCWQFTGWDCAERFETLKDARKAKNKQEAAGFPPLTIFKLEQTVKVVAVIQ